MASILRVSRSVQLMGQRAFVRPFSVQTAVLGEKSALDADKGSIGSKFQPGGEAAETAKNAGGPFHEQGSVGSQFRKDGAVGGKVQDAAEQLQGDKPPLMDKDGAIGRQFQEGGNIAQVGEAIGGPFSSKGAVGKQFNADGAIGGTVQENLGSGKKE